MRMPEPSRTREGRPEPIWADLVMPANADAEAKDPLAVEFGRRGGLKGGRARAARLTADERSEAARRAAAARWGVRPEAVRLPTEPSVAIASAATDFRESLAGSTFGTIVADSALAIRESDREGCS